MPEGFISGSILAAIPLSSRLLLNSGLRISFIFFVCAYLTILLPRSRGLFFHNKVFGQYRMKYSRFPCISIVHKSLKIKDSCRLGSRLFSDNAGDFKLQTVLLCGPSGVGKGTLIERLLTEYSSTFSLSVSHTSRKPRQGEIDGLHYHFIDRESLQKDIQTGPIRFIEHAEVHGNLYGTREDAVSRIHKEGKLCLLDLDTNGAQQLKAIGYPLKSIFIAPPSFRDLESRLSGRGTEDKNQLALRLKNAQKEVEYGLTKGNFDFVVVNDNLDICYEEICDKIKVWFPLFFLVQSSSRKFDKMASEPRKPSIRLMPEDYKLL